MDACIFSVAENIMRASWSWWWLMMAGAATCALASVAVWTDPRTENCLCGAFFGSSVQVKVNHDALGQRYCQCVISQPIRLMVPYNQTIASTMACSNLPDRLHCSRCTVVNSCVTRALMGIPPNCALVNMQQHAGCIQLLQLFREAFAACEPERKGDTSEVHCISSVS